MTTTRTKTTLTALVTGLVLLGVGATYVQAQPTTLGQIGTRALTPQEITNHGLPSTTQTSGGLYTVGLGQPAYLEVQMLQSFPAGEVTDVVWAIQSKPMGSMADLEDSPILPEMPIYNPGDRGFYQLVGARKMLRPDMVGTYVVTAEVSTNGGSFTLTRNVVGSTYLGVNNSCLFCHSGGYLPDKIGPWSMSRHSQAFTDKIDGIGTSHFNQNCIKCHAVGYDTTPQADNGGFDDVQADTGWVFPPETVPGNWAAMPQALKDKSNVQCENCHGAGSEHAYGLGKTNNISVSFSAGDCAQCHDALPYHVKGTEWANSLHSVATRYPTGEGRDSCVRCHSGVGFVDYSDGVPQAERRTDYEAITCAACHDPHGEGNPHLLRRLEPVTLFDEVTVVDGGGFGQLCMNCHVARRNAVDYVETTTGSSRFGPHYGPQTDMLVGANAITYGKDIPSSAHRDAVENTCVACHLQETSRNDPYHGKVGGHTFRNFWDGDTPEDPSDDVALVSLCSDCHGPIESFDFKRADYDGDGVVEGVQTEVKRLMDQLGRLLPPYGSPTVAVDRNYTKPELRAAYNYLFVEDDGSHGVHNLAYTVGLLKASIIDLTDDADHDGLSDTWEIENFGSITLYNGFDDVDGDQVSNSLELAAGTNPNLEDTDGDGFSDKAELDAGSDPTNADDQPGFLVKIYTAAEVEFASEMGKRYQVQSVSDLGMEWVNEGSVTNGTGDNISMVTSARGNGGKRYFRVVEVE